MGMLVTILLITITVYKGTEAPKSRGFSMIEIWMIGNIVPIIVAMVEYGLILYLMRNADTNKITEKKMKLFDKLTMITMIIYFMLFQLWFWIPLLY